MDSHIDVDLNTFKAPLEENRHSLSSIPLEKRSSLLHLFTPDHLSLLVVNRPQ
jgi:hypothetical protein